ncbi:MAG: peptidoglycan-binding protein [bacterium]
MIRWQEKYASEILVPWGETHGTGYVFITSLRKFKMLFESQCQKNTTEKPDPSVLFPRDLRLEMEGDDVRRLQEILIKKATGPAAQELAKTGITGHFGPLTKAALIEFQKSRLLNPANGEMGIITVYLLTE